MSDESIRPGQVSSTPQGGPLDEGAPASHPGAGQVQSTPEAGPLAEGEALVPPTWREHMSGPILGLDDVPQAATPLAVPAAARVGAPDTSQEPAGTARDDELRQWPPFSGKPVSEVRWDALRYAAPVAAQAEKLAIKAIDLTGRGLSGLARFLESRREKREAERDQGQDDR